MSGGNCGEQTGTVPICFPQALTHDPGPSVWPRASRFPPPRAGPPAPRILIGRDDGIGFNRPLFTFDIITVTLAMLFICPHGTFEGNIIPFDVFNVVDLQQNWMVYKPQNLIQMASVQTARELLCLPVNWVCCLNQFLALYGKYFLKTA